jgi:DNA-3-methyladenine glycosylase II
MNSEAAFLSTVDHLTSTDLHLRRIVDEHGRPKHFSRPASFQTLILLILEQQVSLDSARAAYDRLEAVIPGVEPDGLLGLSDQELRKVGFSRQKTRYARELANRALDERLNPLGLAVKSDDQVRAELTSIPGIGPWTADVFLMSSLDRPDVWPVGDRALQVATAEGLELSSVPGPAEMHAIGERWRPHRSAAAQILWHGYLSTRNRTIPSPP